MGDMICQVCASKVIWGWGTENLQVNKDFGNSDGLGAGRGFHQTSL